MAGMQGLLAAIRNVVPNRNKVRDQPRRREYYDGTEKAELTPPARYARGKKAVPAPPPVTF